MPLYVADYLADTGHLSTIEHGAYLLLIMHYWQNGGLPAGDAKLARIARMPLRDWQAIQPTLADLFSPGWVHKRIDAELSKTGLVISKRSAAGKAGAAARYGKGNGKGNAGAMADADQTNGQPQPQPEPQATAAVLDSEPREAADLDRIEDVCRKAAGLENDPSPGFLNLSPLLGLLGNGYPLDLIATVLRSHKGRGKPRSWAYFVPSIEQAGWANSAIKPAGNGHDPDVSDADRARLRDESNPHTWELRLKVGRERKMWPRPTWGGMPGEAGCRVPPELLLPGDGDGWAEWGQAT